MYAHTYAIRLRSEMFNMNMHTIRLCWQMNKIYKKYRYLCIHTQV